MDQTSIKCMPGTPSETPSQTQTPSMFLGVSCCRESHAQCSSLTNPPSASNTPSETPSQTQTPSVFSGVSHCRESHVRRSSLTNPPSASNTPTKTPSQTQTPSASSGISHCPTLLLLLPPILVPDSTTQPVASQQECRDGHRCRCRHGGYGYGGSGAQPAPSGSFPVLSGRCSYFPGAEHPLFLLH
ncbi:hypothetical protein DFH29DRAFT_1003488 [Suillus ampliporus]|nr:hypothetical protein DFH29DRAFT_1003488 [Suillus ampliporus]